MSAILNPTAVGEALDKFIVEEDVCAFSRIHCNLNDSMEQQFPKEEYDRKNMMLGSLLYDRGYKASANHLNAFKNIIIGIVTGNL